MLQSNFPFTMLHLLQAFPKYTDEIITFTRLNSTGPVQFRLKAEKLQEFDDPKHDSFFYKIQTYVSVVVRNGISDPTFWTPI